MRNIIFRKAKASDEYKILSLVKEVDSVKFRMKK